MTGRSRGRGKGRARSSRVISSSSSSGTDSDLEDIFEAKRAPSTTAAVTSSTTALLDPVPSPTLPVRRLPAPPPSGRLPVHLTWKGLQIFVPDVVLTAEVKAIADRALQRLIDLKNAAKNKRDSDEDSESDTGTQSTFSSAKTRKTLASSLSSEKLGDVSSVPEEDGSSRRHGSFSSTKSMYTGTTVTTLRDFDWKKGKDKPSATSSGSSSAVETKSIASREGHEMGPPGKGNLQAAPANVVETTTPGIVDVNLKPKYACNICGIDLNSDFMFKRHAIIHSNPPAPGYKFGPCKCGARLRVKNRLETHQKSCKVFNYFSQAIIPPDQRGKEKSNLKVSYTNDGNEDDEVKIIATATSDSPPASAASISQSTSRESQSQSLTTTAVSTKISTSSKSRNGDGVFTCDICNSSYAYGVDIAHHKRNCLRMREEKDELGRERKFPCSVCPWRFIQRIQLQKHLASHVTTPTPSQQSSSSSLSVSIPSSSSSEAPVPAAATAAFSPTEGKKVACPYGCPSTAFATTYTLHHHLRHFHKCPKCGDDYANHDKQRSHMIFCGKTGYLDEDTELYKKFKCPVCKVAFLPKSLVIHVQTEHQIQITPIVEPTKEVVSSLQCDICQRTFQGANAVKELSRHYASHASTSTPVPVPAVSAIPVTQVVSCKFPACTRFFSHDEDLWFHIEKMHKTSSQLCCGKCGLDFKTAKLLNQHESTVHNDEDDESQVKTEPLPKKITTVSASSKSSKQKTYAPPIDSDSDSDYVPLDEPEEVSCNDDDVEMEEGAQDQETRAPTPTVKPKPKSPLLFSLHAKEVYTPYVFITAHCKELADEALKKLQASTNQGRKASPIPSSVASIPSTSSYNDDVIVEGGFICGYCGAAGIWKMFQSAVEYKAHVAYHKSVGRLEVKTKPKKPKGIRSRRGRPRSKVPVQDTYGCTICQLNPVTGEMKTFKTRQSYFGHMNYHRRLRLAHGMRKLKRDGDGRSGIPLQDEYVCTICRSSGPVRVFKTRQMYISHLNYHRRIRQLHGADRCVEKGRRLRRPDIPIQDEYFCKLCDAEKIPLDKRVYQSRQMYMLHLNQHEKLRGQGKTFKYDKRGRKRGMVKSVKTLQPASPNKGVTKLHKCYVCNEEFTEPLVLDAHVRESHPIDYEEFMQFKQKQQQGLEMNDEDDDDEDGPLPVYPEVLMGSYEEEGDEKEIEQETDDLASQNLISFSTTIFEPESPERINQEDETIQNKSPTRGKGWNFIPGLADQDESTNSASECSDEDMKNSLMPQSFEVEDVELPMGYSIPLSATRPTSYSSSSKSRRTSSDTNSSIKSKKSTSTDVKSVFKCGYCKRLFVASNRVKQHITMVHRVKDYKYEELSDSDSIARYYREATGRGRSIPAPGPATRIRAPSTSTVSVSTSPASVTTIASPMVSGSVGQMSWSIPNTYLQTLATTPMLHRRLSQQGLGHSAPAIATVSPLTHSHSSQPLASTALVRGLPQCSCAFEDTALGVLKRCTGVGCECYKRYKGCGDTCQCRKSCGNPYTRTSVPTATIIPQTQSTVATTTVVATPSTSTNANSYIATLTGQDIVNCIIEGAVRKHLNSTSTSSETIRPSSSSNTSPLNLSFQQPQPPPSYQDAVTFRLQRPPLQASGIRKDLGNSSGGVTQITRLPASTTFPPAVSLFSLMPSLPTTSSTRPFILSTAPQQGLAVRTRNSNTATGSRASQLRRNNNPISEVQVHRVVPVTYSTPSISNAIASATTTTTESVATTTPAPAPARRRSSNSTRVYRCFCQSDFISLSSFLTHQWNHKHEQLFICPICSNPFTTVMNLILHARNHAEMEGATLIPCSVCEHIFSSREEMDRHYTSAHPSLICDVCQKLCYSNIEFSTHRQNHPSCGFCNLTLASQNQLRVHITMEHSSDTLSIVLAKDEGNQQGQGNRTTHPSTTETESLAATSSTSVATVTAIPSTSTSSAPVTLSTPKIIDLIDLVDDESDNPLQLDARPPSPKLPVIVTVATSSCPQGTETESSSSSATTSTTTAASQLEVTSSAEDLPIPEKQA